MTTTIHHDGVEITRIKRNQTSKLFAKAERLEAFVYTLDECYIARVCNPQDATKEYFTDCEGRTPKHCPEVTRHDNGMCVFYKIEYSKRYWVRLYEPSVYKKLVAAELEEQANERAVQSIIDTITRQKQFDNTFETLVNGLVWVVEHLYDHTDPRVSTQFEGVGLREICKHATMLAMHRLEDKLTHTSNAKFEWVKCTARLSGLCVVRCAKVGA